MNVETGDAPFTVQFFGLAQFAVEQSHLVERVGDSWVLIGDDRDGIVEKDAEQVRKLLLVHSQRVRVVYDGLDDVVKATLFREGGHLEMDMSLRLNSAQNVC